MFEIVDWSSWRVAAAKEIGCFGGLVVDLAVEHQQEPSSGTMEALRNRIESLAALAEYLGEELSALRG